ncbi:MAG: carbohydrate binding domain-containing protein, partial [Paraprevotella sp.]|nr:carbohydrate binding domain-containing protein [Paraprevotella sp.]
MKKHIIDKALRMALLGWGLSSGVQCLAAVPDSVYLVAYNARATDGLNFAWSANRRNWTGIGPGYAFVKSDFGAWGAEKKMYHPDLIRMPDGTWRCVFQLNDHSNQFAVAYSEDLVKWRPQDYPYMEGVSSCIAPVLSYDIPSATYKVVFKTKEGDVSATFSKDFFHFDKPRKVDASAYAAASEQAMVNGAAVSGPMFKVPYAQVEHMVQAVESAAYRDALDNELARDNEARFRDLKPLEATIKIDAEHKKKISDKLIGIFFEDINYSADGGLYAELVQNRDFEYAQEDVRGSDKAWKADYGWSIEGNGGVWSIQDAQPVHANNAHYAVLDVKQPGQLALLNGGYDGMVLHKGEKYDFSMFARQLAGKGGKIRVSVVQEGHVVAQTSVKSQSGDWSKVSAVLKADADADHASIRLEPQGEGKVALDLISLFPQNTFKGRKNGLRVDLAQALADLKPKFMRFPGGCVAHGDGLHNIYNWKETIGPLESRKPQRNLWGYHQSKGLGFYEYFQFCEDLGCEPLPVLAAGVSCQNSSDGGAGQQGGIPMDKMPQYVQDVLDLIEWANGDAKTTRWGKLRAEEGHPAPFHLKYIGIGNEDLISRTFEERYLMIVKAVKEKYPDIIVCGTAGPWSDGSDYEQGWRLAKDHKIDMVDEHYYRSTGWFVHHQDYYDQYDREGSKVYLGEYAAHAPGRPSDMETALCEAMHICGMERNGDVVAMSSYAPLLAKEDHTQWTPDMIYFNNKEVKPTVGYYVQKLCGNHSGDEYIESSLSVNENRKGVRERLAVSTVRDSHTGKVYIKMVNLLNHPVKGQLDLSSLKDRFGEAQSVDSRLYLLTGNYDDSDARPQ